MKTLRLTKEEKNKVIELLNQNEVVAFPTDTVYGAAIRYDRLDAIQNLKNVKQRPETKPFPMMIGDKSQIEQVAIVSEKAQRLIDKFMPGAITLVFNKKDSVSDEVTNGFKTIAIRMPDDSWICDLIANVGVPLLVPSANISGEKVTHTSDEVLNQLDGRIAAVILGESGGSLSSTIVDVTGDECKILRQGPISQNDIEEVFNQ